MSPHRVSLDIVRPLVGMLTAINESEWQSLTPATLTGKSNFLRRVAKQVDVVAYRKTDRIPSTNMLKALGNSGRKINNRLESYSYERA